MHIDTSPFVKRMFVRFTSMKEEMHAADVKQSSTARHFYDAYENGPIFLRYESLTLEAAGLLRSEHYRILDCSTSSNVSN